MITLHDLLDNFCCIDPYTDYAIVNIETGEVLVDRVHDRTYTVDDVDDYAKLLPYARKQVRAWETKRWENDILYSAAKKKEGKAMKPTMKNKLSTGKRNDFTSLHLGVISTSTSSRR